MKDINILEETKKRLKDHIKAERTNFLFLEDGSMYYDYCNFLTFQDAAVDAVINHGEDLDDLLALIYPYKFDHSQIKEKFVKMIEEAKSNKKPQELNS